MDLFDYTVVVAAVALLGIAKGGFGGIGTPVALPLMSLGLPTEVALGVLLPLLLATDGVSVIAHRRAMHMPTILYALPGAFLGVLLGAALIVSVPSQLIGGLVGALAVLFAVMALTKRSPDISAWPGWVGGVFGAASGFTSAVAHAGGPPIHIYLLARNFSRAVFVATASGFMAGVNLLKVGPYLWIGVLDRALLGWVAALAPVAVISAVFGVWLARVLSKRVFAFCVNWLLLLVGAKLVFEAFS